MDLLFVHLGLLGAWSVLSAPEEIIPTFAGLLEK
jgi:hypothetical protein